jgi:small neutral amino acid transporter SnatA (MarC family)
MKALLVLTLGALALLPAAYGSPARTARVAITDMAPFTVHGSGFAANESVTITVEAKQRAVRKKTAGPTGTFTVRFLTVTVDRCASYVVRAVGSKGSLAVKKVFPQCAPTAPGDEPAPLYPIDPTPKTR